MPAVRQDRAAVMPGTDQIVGPEDLVVVGAEAAVVAMPGRTQHHVLAVDLVEVAADIAANRRASVGDLDGIGIAPGA